MVKVPILGHLLIYVVQDGVFDPPIALTQAPDAAGPTLPGIYPALTTASSNLIATSTAASPASAAITDIEPTAQADQLDDNGGQSTRPEASSQHGEDPTRGLGAIIASGLGMMEESSSSAESVSSTAVASMEMSPTLSEPMLTTKGGISRPVGQTTTSSPEQSTISEQSITSLWSLTQEAVSSSTSTVEPDSSTAIQPSENASTRNSGMIVLALWLAASVVHAVFTA